MAVDATSRAWRDAGRALLVTRAIVWAGAGLGLAIAGLSDRSADFDPTGITRPFGEVGDALLAPVARWDAVWFLAIAQDGYGTDAGSPAFFGLYPALVRLLGTVTGSLVVGGLLVSVVAFAVALWAVGRLTALELGPEAARWTVWLLALFPMAFFHTAIYSEGLFLALSAGALLAARTDRWWLAGLLGAAAAGTRSAGLVLLVPLAVMAWQRRAAWRDAAWLALVPGGLLAFCGFLELTGTGWRAAFDAQAVWYRAWGGPLSGAWDGTVAAWDGARQLLSGSRTPVYFEAAGDDPFRVAWTNLALWASLVLVVPVVVGVWRRLPAAYGAYVCCALALPLSYPVAPQPLMSLPRFEAVLFPLAMWGGWFLARRGPRTRAVVLGASAVGLALATARFATWRWVA